MRVKYVLILIKLVFHPGRMMSVSRSSDRLTTRPPRIVFDLERVTASVGDSGAHETSGRATQEPFGCWSRGVPFFQREPQNSDGVI